MKLAEPELRNGLVAPATTITRVLPDVLYPAGLVTVMLPPNIVFGVQVMPEAPPVELMVILSSIAFAENVIFVPAIKYNESAELSALSNVPPEGGLPVAPTYMFENELVLPPLGTAPLIETEPLVAEMSFVWWLIVIDMVHLFMRK